MNLPGLGALGDLGKLCGLPARMREVQAELAARTVEGSAGGGLVTVTASGTGELLSVKIDPELLQGEDRAMIGDLVAAAANQTLARARELAASEMQKALGGLIPPGLAGLAGLPGTPKGGSGS
jgi:hypothetical protein